MSTCHRINPALTAISSPVLVPLSGVFEFTSLFDVCVLSNLIVLSSCHTRRDITLTLGNGSSLQNLLFTSTIVVLVRNRGEKVQVGNSPENSSPFFLLFCREKSA